MDYGQTISFGNILNHVILKQIILNVTFGKPKSLVEPQNTNHSF